MRYISTLAVLLLSTFAVSAQIDTPQAITPQIGTPQIVVPQIVVPSENIQQDSIPQDSIPRDTVPVVIPRKPIKEHLATPVQLDSLTTINETVHIIENGDAAAIAERNLNMEPQKVKGYRIVIFMKNAQSARREAVAMQEEFALKFPEEPSYLIYENPYFKVSVGNYTTTEEAMVFLGRIRSEFPKAHIAPENIDVKEFAR